MASTKTAISLPTALFEQAEQLARKMHISRSQLFALALVEFVRRQENRELLEQINRVYDEDEPDEEEQTYLAQMRRLYRETMEDIEW